MKPLRATFAVLIVGTVLISPATRAADWPQFRGPDRNGTSKEKGITASWNPESGPTELWRVPVGPAFSGIAVVGDQLFTMSSDDEHEYLVAMSSTTGAELWRTQVGGLFTNDFGNGPRATPTVDGGLVFAVSSLGRLVAANVETGTVAWSRDLQADFDSPLPNWAFSSSPLVLGEAVVLEIGGTKDRAVGAFGRRDGELLWTGGSGEIAYSSPIAVPFNGVTQLVFLTKDGLSALTPEGATIWSSEFVPDLGIKPVPPLFVAPDLIFASASYEAGAKVVRMVDKGPSVDVEEVWQHRLMRNHFNGSVEVDGHVCGFDKAFLKCLDASTGETTWTRRGLGKGSLVKADGKLIVLSERGKLVLFEANPARAVELASHQALTGRCWTQPAIANGTLYLRNDSEMVAYDLSTGGS